MVPPSASLNRPTRDDTAPVKAYGVGKIQCERYLHRLYEDHGLPYTVFRVSHSIGPRSPLASREPIYFERLTLIEVTVDMQQKESKHVEFVVQAEHKHDFVARESNGEVLVALDHTLTKIEGQLRRYKEKIQDHRRDPSAGEIAAASEPRGPTEE